MVRWCWVHIQCRGVLLIWIIVGQRPFALAVGVGGSCLDIFTLLYLFSPLSSSLGDGPIETEILSQRALKPKTTNQLINCIGAKGEARRPLIFLTLLQTLQRRIR